MSEGPKVDVELIRSVLPGMATGVVSRLHALTGQPATIVMFVVDVEGNLHGTNNFTTNQDMEAFICALADGYREKSEAMGEEMLTRLYYEAHITITPDSFITYEDFAAGVANDDWRVGKFEHDDVDGIAGKWFISAKHRSETRIREMVRGMLSSLEVAELAVERWKIEEAMMDSKHGDSEEMLNA